MSEVAARHASVGVVAPERLVDELGEALGVQRRPSGPAQLVGPAEAKGLEFDAVVVVEPAAIVDGAADRSSGLRLLYVALTRAVQELVVVHSDPLPQALSA